MTVVYDKLAFMRRLENDGAFSRQQAEVLSEAIHEAMNEGVATKADIVELRQDLARLEAKLGAKLDGDIASVRSDMGLMRAELKFWTGTVAAGLFAALFTSLGGLMAIFRFVIH